MELYHKLHGKNVIFNDEGELIEWTDSVYHKEVENRGQIRSRACMQVLNLNGQTIRNAS